MLEALKDAAESSKRLHVYVTESSSDGSGRVMKADLDRLGIPNTLVLDASVGYVMSSVDFVLVGAEGVVESGGVVNKIGTFTIALVAKEMNKPLYVMCESYKFVRLYPLGQSDLPNEFKVNVIDDIYPFCLQLIYSITRALWPTRRTSTRSTRSWTTRRRRSSTSSSQTLAS